MTDFSKMKKTELTDIIVKLNGENKELKQLLSGTKSNADKPFTAVSVLKIDGDFCAVKVGFNEADIIDTITYDDKRPHMADYEAKKILHRDIIQKNQEINHDK